MFITHLAQNHMIIFTLRGTVSGTTFLIYSVTFTAILRLKPKLLYPIYRIIKLTKLPRRIVQGGEPMQVRLHLVMRMHLLSTLM